MALSIKDPEADALARRLAALTGETLTEAVMVALRERLSRTKRATQVPQREAKLRLLQAAFARLPVQDERPAAELVEYDEDGLPR